jgi:predicted lipoprotein with Yx(FWY)xxD motif
MARSTQGGDVQGRGTQLFWALAMVAVLGACKQYDSPTTQSSPATGDAAPAPTTASGAIGAPGPAAPAAVPDQPNETGADLGVANSADHGKYLVDATGRTLYILQKDSTGASSCYDACSTQWPPLLAPKGKPKALDPSIQGNAIVNIQRTDGSVQVTYHGHPLYHYAQDQAAGQINGAGVKDQFGEWYLVTPAGEPMLH